MDKNTNFNSPFYNNQAMFVSQVNMFNWWLWLFYYEIVLCLQARPLLLRAIETRDFSDLIDPRLKKHFVENEMLRMVEVAAACVRHSAPRRPRMVQVITIPKIYVLVHPPTI